MTERQKEAVELRLDGKSYQEIGDILCISKQEAHNLVKKAVEDIPTKWQQRAADVCVYPRLAQWMRDNRCSMMMISRMTGATPGTVRRFVHGNNVTLDTAQRIADLTGMTVDEVLCRD